MKIFQFQNLGLCIMHAIVWNRVDLRNLINLLFHLCITILARESDYRPTKSETRGTKFDKIKNCEPPPPPIVDWYIRLQTPHFN